MVKIVVPLRVERVAALGAWVDDADIFEVALGDQPGLALEPVRLIAESIRQFVENVTSAEVVDAMDGVQAKRVDVIFSKPIQGVVDDEAANAVALGPVKIDRLSPGRMVGIGEAGCGPQSHAIISEGWREVGQQRNTTATE